MEEIGNDRSFAVFGTLRLKRELTFEKRTDLFRFNLSDLQCILFEFSSLVSSGRRCMWYNPGPQIVKTQGLRTSVKIPPREKGPVWEPRPVATRGHRHMSSLRRIRTLKPEPAQRQLILHCEIPRNLSRSIWWISVRFHFQWKLSYLG